MALQQLQSGDIGAVANTSISGTITPTQLSTGAPAWNSSGALGIGISPSYGTFGQVLTSQGSGSATLWKSLQYTANYLIVAGGGSGGACGYAQNVGGGGGGVGST